jgi:hypothetical protein
MLCYYSNNNNSKLGTRLELNYFRFKFAFKNTIPCGFDLTCNPLHCKRFVYLQVIKIYTTACSDILPTKDKLFKKHITLDPLGPICYLEVESIGHTLWSYPSAQDVWAECSTKIQKSLSVATNFMSIMDRMLERCLVEEVQLAVLVARQI